MSQSGQTAGLDDEFVLDVKPEPQNIGTARAFAAALARHFDQTEDRVQDVKVAVSEACSSAVKAHRTETIRLSVNQTDGGIWYQVTGADDAADGGVGLVLIRALFPHTEVLKSQDGSATIRFFVPEPEPAI